MAVRVGVRIDRTRPADRISADARLIEQLGFDEAWVVEDLGYGGGIAQAATVLAATRRLPVGIGILAAVVRNPAYTAMEAGTLAALHPGRLTLGIGHGVQSWMADIGAHVESPLTALRETITAVSELLHGRTLSTQGRYVRLHDISLTPAPPSAPPLLAGVRGPRSLRTAGEICDGALLAEPATPAYITQARAELDPAAQRAGRPRPVLAAYCWFSVDADPAAARDRLRPVLAVNLADPEAGPHLRGQPFAADLQTRLRAAPTPPDGEAIEPDWVSELAIAGTPEQCRRSVQRLHDAGLDRLILLAPPGTEQQQWTLFARAVLPTLRHTESPPPT